MASKIKTFIYIYTSARWFPEPRPKKIFERNVERVTLHSKGKFSVQSKKELASLVAEAANISRRMKSRCEITRENANSLRKATHDLEKERKKKFLQSSRFQQWQLFERKETSILNISLRNKFPRQHWAHFLFQTSFVVSSSCLRVLRNFLL